MNRISRVLPTAVVILATASFLCSAETLYRWTDSDGQPYFSDRPPDGQHTLSRQQTGNSPAPRSGMDGLRQGERRILEHLHRQDTARSLARQQTRLEIRQQQAASRQACRKLGQQLYETRDDSLRKQLAGRLRRECWQVLP